MHSATLSRFGVGVKMDTALKDVSTRQEYHKKYYKNNADYLKTLARINHHKNKKKKNEAFKKKYHSDPAFRAELAKRRKKWTIENKERVAKHKKESHYKKRYGLSIIQVEQKKKLQNYKCACCNKRKPLVVDHCHKTNIPRDLLCQRCNVGVGYVEDKIFLLQALEYKQRWDELLAA